MANGYENGIVAVLFTQEAGWELDTPFSKKGLNKAYGIFADRAYKKGLTIFIAKHDQYDNGIVRKAWIYNNYNKRWKKAENIKPDIIYSRFNKAIYNSYSKNKKAESLKLKMHEQVGLFNHPDIEEFCWDKCIVSELFPKYTPKTFLVNTIKGLKLILPEIKTDKLVLKPRYGTLGEDVVITTKDRLPSKIKKNTIAQEFIDGSRGIKGLVKGYHDMRLIVINGKVDHSHVRIPKEGLLTANMALGGTKVWVKNSKIPKKALYIAKRVDKLMEIYYPRLFSVDFIFDKNQRPYIIECNGSPTMHRYAYGKYKKISYFDNVLSAIKSGIRIKVTKNC